MNLAPLLRQSVAWAQVTSEDDRDDVTYGPPQLVTAVKRSSSKEVISATGEVTTAAFKILLLTAPNLRDLLDGRTVIRVDTVTDYAGVDAGYLAYTE